MAAVRSVAMPLRMTTKPTHWRFCTGPLRHRRCDMKIPNYQYRCPLGRLQPQTTDLDAIKERGWRDQHILVVSESDERLDFVEREFVRGSVSVCTVPATSRGGRHDWWCTDTWRPGSKRLPTRDDACLQCGCKATSLLACLRAQEWRRWLPTRRSTDPSRQVPRTSTGCWRHALGAVAGGRAAPPGLDAGQALRLA
jgi:hypothetical protein